MSNGSGWRKDPAWRQRIRNGIADRAAGRVEAITSLPTKLPKIAKAGLACVFDGKHWTVYAPRSGELKAVSQPLETLDEAVSVFKVEIRQQQFLPKKS